MQHLPKQAVFLGRGLQARFDCCYQPLPDELNVLLGSLMELNGEDVSKQHSTLGKG